MKITAIHVRDYKRIRDIQITPDADRHLLLIGGKNAQGKSSLLDAVMVAFGGKDEIPADPVRHGAQNAEIRVELDGGALLIRRTIKPDRGTQLEVRNEGGTVKSPQAMLSGLVSQRFLDPLAFLHDKPAAQRAALLKLVAGADQLAKLDAQRSAAFDKRRSVGQMLTRARGELDRMGAPPAPVDVPDSSALTDAIRVANDAVMARKGAVAQLERARAAFAATRDQIAKLEAQLVELREQLAQHEADGRAAHDALRAMRPAADLDAALAAARADLDAAAARANDAIAAQVRREQHAKAVADVERWQAEHTALDAEIKQVDTDKAALLAAAELPAPGLGVSEDGITLNGAPFEQASSAERLVTAVAIAAAAAPALRDILIRDGALLDDDHLAMLEGAASARGLRMWIERVGEHDEGAIVIRDGGVVS